MNQFLIEITALLSDWRTLAALAVTAVAGLMRGYSGFGTAILLAPTYSLLWGPRVGVPVMLRRGVACSGCRSPQKIVSHSTTL